MSLHKLNDKKIINGWAFFDWANSSYALIISAAIFPAYFSSVMDEQITYFGQVIERGTWYSFAISISYLIITILSPILSGIADFRGNRKKFLKFFTALGAVSCMILFWFKGMDQLWLGTICFMLANIGFSGGLVFYDSYLPQIATVDQYDKVSARGFAFGYIGSVILLLLNLVVILKPEWFGIENVQLPYRIAFFMVGLWWLGFAQIPFKRLPSDVIIKSTGNLIKKGYSELYSVWKKVQKQKYVKRFLMSFFFYSAGVQSILYLAAIFAEQELEFGGQELIFIILILQIVGIAGAFLFSRISRIMGNKASIIIMLLIWLSICAAAFFVVEKSHFYMVAAAVGLVMGGIQAISRSTYAKLIEEKEKDLASYFSFYDVLYKASIVVGTFSFGLVEQLTGGMRNSVLALGIFFFIGLVIIFTIKMNRTPEATLQASPAA